MMLKKYSKKNNKKKTIKKKKVKKKTIKKKKVKQKKFILDVIEKKIVVFCDTIFEGQINTVSKPFLPCEGIW